MRGWEEEGRRRGSSLAELLVALTLLSIGMAATVALLTMATRAMGHAEIGLRAMLTATEVLADPTLGPEGSRDSAAGRFRWRRMPAPEAGLELRYEPPGEASDEDTSEEDGSLREWRLDPAVEPPGGWASWSSW